MYQIVGVVVCNNEDIGIVLFDNSVKSLVMVKYAEVTYEDMTIIEGKVKNFWEFNRSNIPVYDINGNPDDNNLPVVIERIVHNNEVVGCTVLNKCMYKTVKVEDLTRMYRQFYNAKVYIRNGKAVISSKRGCLNVIDLGDKKFVEKSIKLMIKGV